MASSGISRFSNSREERNLKNALEMIKQTYFLNLTIDSCNGKAGKRFSNASVELAHIVKIRETFGTGSVTQPLKCKQLSMLHVLKEDILMDFISNGVKAVENYPDTTSVFLCMLEFLKDLEQNEEALQKIIHNGNGMTDVMVVLGHHFLSQLVPNKEYLVDHQSSQIPEMCKCGCRSKIMKGNTKIGSPLTWHGRFDILLNQTVPVTILNDNNEETTERETPEGQHIEPAAKKKRTETVRGKTEYELFVEAEKNKRPEHLLEENVLDKILSECITNGFAQVNMNKTLSGMLVPTFGCTSEYVSICLYDSANDILLHIKKPLHLWTRPLPKLDTVTIVVVWLFLNFTTFGVQNLEKSLHIVLDKSGFHDKMDQYLQCYKAVRTKMDCLPLLSPLWHRAYGFCEVIQLKSSAA